MNSATESFNTFQKRFNTFPSDIEAVDDFVSSFLRGIVSVTVALRVGPDGIGDILGQFYFNWRTGKEGALFRKLEERAKERANKVHSHSLSMNDEVVFALNPSEISSRRSMRMRQLQQDILAQAARNQVPAKRDMATQTQYHPATGPAIHQADIEEAMVTIHTLLKSDSYLQGKHAVINRLLSNIQAIVETLCDPDDDADLAKSTTSSCALVQSTDDKHSPFSPAGFSASIVQDEEEFYLPHRWRSHKLIQLLLEIRKDSTVVMTRIRQAIVDMENNKIRRAVDLTQQNIDSLLDAYKELKKAVGILGKDVDTIHLFTPRQALHVLKKCIPLSIQERAISQGADLTDSYITSQLKLNATYAQREMFEQTELQYHHQISTSFAKTTTKAIANTTLIQHTAHTTDGKAVRDKRADQPSNTTTSRRNRPKTRHNKTDKQREDTHAQGEKPKDTPTAPTTQQQNIKPAAEEASIERRPHTTAKCVDGIPLNTPINLSLHSPSHLVHADGGANVTCFGPILQKYIDKLMDAPSINMATQSSTVRLTQAARATFGVFTKDKQRANVSIFGYIHRFDNFGIKVDSAYTGMVLFGNSSPYIEVEGEAEVDGRIFARIFPPFADADVTVTHGTLINNAWYTNQRSDNIIPSSHSTKVLVRDTTHKLGTKAAADRLGMSTDDLPSDEAEIIQIRRLAQGLFASPSTVWASLKEQRIKATLNLVQENLRSWNELLTTTEFRSKHRRLLPAALAGKADDREEENLPHEELIGRIDADLTYLALHPRLTPEEERDLSQEEKQAVSNSHSNGSILVMLERTSQAIKLVKLASETKENIQAEIERWIAELASTTGIKVKRLHADAAGVFDISTPGIWRSQGAPSSKTHNAAIEGAIKRIKRLIYAVSATLTQYVWHWEYLLKTVEHVWNIRATANHSSPHFTLYGTPPSYRYLPRDRVVFRTSNPSLMMHEPRITAHASNIAGEFLWREHAKAGIMFTTYTEYIFAQCDYRDIHKVSLSPAQWKTLITERHFQEPHNIDTDSKRSVGILPGKIVSPLVSEAQLLQLPKDMVTHHAYHNLHMEPDFPRTVGLSAQAVTDPDDYTQPNIFVGLHNHSFVAFPLPSSKTADVTVYNGHQKYTVNHQDIQHISFSHPDELHILYPVAAAATARTSLDASRSDILSGLFDESRRKEIGAMIRMGVYGRFFKDKRDAQRQGYTHVNSRFVDTWKLKDDKRVTKSRLVAQEISHKNHGLDVYFHLPKLFDVQMFLFIAAQRNITLWTGDISNAYLTQQPVRKIATTLPPMPPGCEEYSRRTVELAKNTYGCIDAGKVFCEGLKATLLEKGWKWIHASIYARGDEVYLAYVDDQMASEQALNEIHRQYPMGSLESITTKGTRFLGTTVRAIQDGYSIDCKEYLQGIQLHEIPRGKVNPAIFKLKEFQPDEESIKQAQTLSGSLAWLGGMNRNIAFARSACASLASKADQKIVGEIKKVIRDFKNHVPDPQQYVKVKNLQIRLWCDASFDRSQFEGRLGCMIQLADLEWTIEDERNIVYWDTMKDVRKHKSTTSVEMNALLMALEAAVALLHAYKPILPTIHSILILSDSEPGINQLKSNGRHTNNKFDLPIIQYVNQCIMDLQSTCKIEYMYVKSSQQQADQLTKYKPFTRACDMQNQGVSQE